MASGHLQLSLLLSFVRIKTTIIHKAKISNNLSVNFKLPRMKWSLSHSSARIIPNTLSKIFPLPVYSVTYDGHTDDMRYLLKTDILHVGGEAEGTIGTGCAFSLSTLTHCGALWKKKNVLILDYSSEFSLSSLFAAAIVQTCILQAARRIIFFKTIFSTFLVKRTLLYSYLKSGTIFW